MLRFMLETCGEDEAQLPTLRQLQGMLQAESGIAIPAAVTSQPAPTATTQTVSVVASDTLTPEATPSTGGYARSRDDGYVMPALPPPPLSSAQKQRIQENTAQSVVVECQFVPETETNAVDLDKYRSPATPARTGAVTTTIEMVPVAHKAAPTSAAAAAPKPSSMLGFLTRCCGEPASSFPTLERLSAMLQEEGNSQGPSPAAPAPAAAVPAPVVPSTAAPSAVPVPLAIPLPMLPGQSEWGGVFTVAAPPPVLPFDNFYAEATHTTHAPAEELAAQAPVPVPLPTAAKAPSTPSPSTTKKAASPHRGHAAGASTSPSTPADPFRLVGQEVPGSSRSRPLSSSPSAGTSRRKQSPSPWQTPHHAAVAGRAPAPASAVNTSALVMESRGLTRQQKTPYAERFMRALYYRNAGSPSPHLQSQRNSQSRQLVVRRLYDQIHSAEQLDEARAAPLPLTVSRMETPAATATPEGLSSRVVSRLERDVQRAAELNPPPSSAADTSAAAAAGVNTSIEAPSSTSSGHVRRASVPRPPPSQPPSSRGRTSRPPSARPTLYTRQTTTTTNTTTTTTTTTTRTTRTAGLLPRAVRGTSATSSSAQRMLPGVVRGRRPSSELSTFPDLAIIGAHVSLPTEHRSMRTRSRFPS